jgi:hypothetical protein
MSLKIRLSQTIDRPVGDVFHFFAEEHVRNHPRWDPTMRMQQLTDGPIGVGTLIRREVSRRSGTITGQMEVVAYEKDRLFGTQIRDGEAEIRSQVSFRPAQPGQTLLSMDVDFADLDDSQADMITGMIQGSLDTIKRLIETEEA